MACRAMAVPSSQRGRNLRFPPQTRFGCTPAFQKSVVKPADPGFLLSAVLIGKFGFGDPASNQLARPCRATCMEDLTLSGCSDYRP